MGTDEGRRTLADVRRLKRMLLRMGYVEGVDLRYVEATGARHNEAAWGARLPAGLEFLLRRFAPREEPLRREFDRRIEPIRGGATR